MTDEEVAGLAVSSRKGGVDLSKALPGVIVAVGVSSRKGGVDLSLSIIVA